MTTPVGTRAPETSWTRLHPLTPLLRGGRVFLLLVALLLQGVVSATGPGLAAGLAVATLPVAAAYGYLSWRFTRWRLVDGDLRLETGVLFRRSRRVPLARLQAVDVVRGLAARVFGLAELRLEVVGGGDSEAPLSYLGQDDAERVRLQLLRAARVVEARAEGVAAADAATEVAADAPPGVPTDAPPGVPAADGTQHPGSSGGTGGAPHADEGVPARPAPEQLLVAVPLRALVGSILLSTPVVGGAVALPLVLVAGLLTRGLALPLLVPVLLGLGGWLVNELQRGFGFTLTRSEDGLRLSHGLLETRTQTVPAGRVQAVRMTEPWLWRRAGWARLEVDVAGYGGGSEQRTQTATLLPVGPRDYAAVLAGLALDGLDLPRVPRQPPPRRARWLAPLAWPRMSAGGTPSHLVVTSGVLTRVTVAAPWGKVQSLRLVAGPVQRRLRLATLHVDTAGRFVRAAAEHRDADEARRMLDSGARLARQARTVDLRG